MRFLTDRCAGAKPAAWLRDNGHAGLEAQSTGADPGDRDLPELATTSGRIMITIDTDFGELIHQQGLPHSGLIRQPDVSAQQRIALTAAAIDHHREELENNALITIRGERIRVSWPPPAQQSTITRHHQSSRGLPARPEPPAAPVHAVASAPPSRRR